MSQRFVGGARIPVTEVVAGPCVVTQIKTLEKDGYWAVQLGFGNKKMSKFTKPEKGHLNKIKNLKSKIQKFPRYLREVRLNDEPNVRVGDVINVFDVLKIGDIVQVSGTSKGKGFAGGMKRWGFKGGPATHGQSDKPRSPGSIGQGTTPGRVRKGKKMAGRMGSDTVTLKNLKIISIDKENNTVSISGAVPGNRGGLLVVKKIK